MSSHNFNPPSLLDGLPPPRIQVVGGIGKLLS
jgi:hypothetical protein